MANQYPQEVRDFIRENATGRKTKELTNLVNERFGLNFSEKAMSVYKSYHRLTRRSILPEKIQEYVKTNYKGVSYRKLADDLNRFFKTSYTREQIKGYCRYHGLHNGVTTAKPVGYECFNARGYVEVKVRLKPSHPRGSDNYALKQHLVWEQAHGPIPAGSKIVFLDGDKANCDIENLRLATNAERGVMMQKGLYNTNPALTESGVLLAKVVVAAKEKKKSHSVSAAERN